MKKRFEKDDLIFCNAQITTCFNLVGYRSDPARMAILGQSLLKTWKTDLPGWDKDDLERHLENLIVDGGVKRLTAPELRLGLKNIYRSIKPKREAEIDLTNRSDLEVSYLNGIALRLLKKQSFDIEEDYSFRVFSLFPMMMELCHEILVPDVINSFRGLYNKLSKVQPGYKPFETPVLKKTNDGKTYRSFNWSDDEVQIFDLANDVMKKLRIQKQQALLSLSKAITQRGGKPCFRVDDIQKSA